MLISGILDGIMARRARQLIEQVRDWLPRDGALLDIGSGTGHVAALLERETGLEVVTADVSDIHVAGRTPVPIRDGVLPFDDSAFSGSLMFFMLAYPENPVAVLAEAARVTRGPVILVQSLYSGPLGHAWHRGREFFWTVVAFHASRLVRYVPRTAEFSMDTRRFYTAETLHRDVAAAGLRVRAHRVRAVLPASALVVAAWRLERDV